MERTGRRGAFGKDRWRCLKQPCEENANYGGARPGPNELARSRAGFGRPNAPMAHARTSA